jgi:hypothetical protein
MWFVECYSFERNSSLENLENFLEMGRGAFVHRNHSALDGLPCFLRLTFLGFGGLFNFISECCFGGIRNSAPMRRLVFSNCVSIMSTSDTEWPLPEHQLAPNNYLAALGQATFVYNMLESMMSSVFPSCAPLEIEAARTLFHKLNNRDRVDLLTDFVTHNEKDKQVKSVILHYINCYDICTENRNILMHAIYFNPNLQPDQSPLLVKKAKNDYKREIHFDVPLQELRNVADGMVRSFQLAMELYGFLARRIFLNALPPTNPATGYPKIGPNPLPDILPKPHKLIPYQPLTNPKGG